MVIGFSYRRFSNVCDVGCADPDFLGGNEGRENSKGRHSATEKGRKGDERLLTGWLRVVSSRARCGMHFVRWNEC